MHRSLSILLAAFISGQGHAFDAPPPPNPKTLEWTIEQANYNLPLMDIKDSTAFWLIEFLDRSDRAPGFYLNIDTSEVEDRLHKKLTFREENITWLSVIGIVADAIEADIVIKPGELKLIPRKQIAAVVESKASKQAGPGQPASQSQSDSEGGDRPQPEAEGRSR